MTNQQRGHVPVAGAGLGCPPSSTQTKHQSNGGAEDVRDFRGDHWKLETQLETTSYIILQHMHVPVDYTLEN